MASKKKIERRERKIKKEQALLALVKSNREQSNRQIQMPIIMEQDSSQLLTNRHKDGEEGRMADDMHLEKDHKLSKEELNEMKKILRERNKLAMQRPKVFLTPNDILPFQYSGVECGTELPPLYIIDLQHLLLYALQGNTSSFKPRWCKLLRVTKVASVVVIFLDGVGYSDFTDDKESFKFIAESFESHVEMICPEQYNCSVDAEIYSVPLSISQIKRKNVKVREELVKEVADKLTPIKKTHSSSLPDANSTSKIKDKFSRVCLLLSSNQMKVEGYPLPVQTEDDKYEDFVYSNDCYAEVTPHSPLFAVDCEMCQTTMKRNELTRVSIVNEAREVIYDTLVKPRNKIINYLTMYSGITKKMLDPINVRIEDVQRDIKKLLPPDAIICGQSLNSDLMALKLFHPYVIDTSVIYNLSGNKRTKAGLKKLTGFFLNRTIQNSSAGHCSAEDAIATLDLVKLKLQRGLEFGDATISGVYFPNIETYFKRNQEGNRAHIDNVEREDRSTSGLSNNSIPPLIDFSNNAHSLSSQDTRLSPASLKRPQPGDSNHSDSKKLKTSHETMMSLKTSHEIGSTSADLNNPWTASRKGLTMFNQENSMHISQSFFKLMDEAGRTGCMIAREPFTSKYEKEPIEKSIVSSDKEAYKSAKQGVQNKEFTWVNFHNLREAMDDPEISQEGLQSKKRKLDRRVEKVLKMVKEKSLVVIVMTGRQTGKKAVNAGTFVKII